VLSDEQIVFYKENGYVLVPGMFTPDESAAFRVECHELADRLAAIRDIDATWASVQSADGAQPTKVLACHDVQFQSAALSGLIVDERLTGAAASIIGPNVQLHHTKMFIKPPEKGFPFPLHQDVPYFPHEKDSLIAAIIHFDDAPLERGCVHVVSDSHLRGRLPHETVDGFHLDLTEYPIESATPLPAKAGDVLFFSYLTIHGSGVNTSDEARTTLLVQMRDPADPPSIRVHESRGQGMMLRGIDPSCATTEPLSDDPNDNPVLLVGAMSRS